MLSVVESGGLSGIEALPVQVEVNTGEMGEPRVVLVGLPGMAVKESQDRVASAVNNSGYSMPSTRTTINLAPGNLRKEGSLYDLPIALGILAATGKLNCEDLRDYIIAGELGLSGETRAVRGGLALALLARKENKKGVLLPLESAEEASLAEEVPVYPIRSLDQAVMFLSGKLDIEPMDPYQSSFRNPPKLEERMDFSEIKGQYAVRRAVEVAVAGGHNLLMIGPPGSGKSMIAKRIPSIMPDPNFDEFLEILTIQSSAGITLSAKNRCLQRPFRSPHHTISDVGLLGGGNPPAPGEVSLSHNGVLFLDELPEFKRSALEVLRQPIEDGKVSISRSMGKVTFPSFVMLVSAMNPCPCGYLGDKRRECRCSSVQVQKYRSRVSGPLLDRIDIHIDAPALSIEDLQSKKEGESSETIKNRVNQARVLQNERFKKLSGINCNAQMSHGVIRETCKLNDEQGKLLHQAMEQLSLSARAYDRILKVARTIADLAQTQEIETQHLLEAIQYRGLDRNIFY